MVTLSRAKDTALVGQLSTQAMQKVHSVMSAVKSSDAIAPVGQSLEHFRHEMHFSTSTLCRNTASFETSPSNPPKGQI